MARICPLCRKLGEIRELQSVPINAEESVLLCPNFKCVWPLGYEGFQFVPSPMPHLGQVPTVKASKCTPAIPISTELSLYTPPVTPSDTQDTTTNLKGTSTDSYASSPGAVTNNQVSADTSPSIFDIDSPEKNRKQSPLLQSCDKKTLGISNVSGSNVSKNKKVRPKVESIERVNVNMSDVKRIKLNSNLVGPAQQGVRILKKVVKKKANVSADGKINSVNNCTNKRPMLMPCNYDTSKLPKINSDVNTSKLRTLLEKVQVKESKNDEEKNFAVIENSQGTCKDFLTLPSGNCNNSGAGTPTVMDEDINLQSIIDDLEASNSVSHQVTDEDDWISALVL
ncbi:uncharacterized protein LOC130667000 [Microplitis mediator]|uniref:uncharacterized protein LOC130667000 n=1 Tax=Microplitis mediator TaxID=375433 RepID=UPI0025574DDD|nr:uncharacterized protein LOC130667000 [Microplitis mediator]